ncbi:MAG: hypothetical protein ABJ007_17780 [Pseudophaeobacter sp.]|jgi:hypothetical protein|uniref:hypothetical protein n=1 Tax=Pseudophaeobacter sp. TaxID=1971739 RepID=UPI00329A3667
MKKMAQIDLTACSDNAFDILARCQRAARQSQVSQADVQEFLLEAVDGNHTHLLATVLKYFEVSMVGAAD